MKRTLYILLSIFIILVIGIFYIYNNFIKVAMLSNKINTEYESYTEGTIVGSSLITLINKAIDHNTKNNVTTGYKDLYKENDTNSIKIEIKFIESDKTFSMESISKLGSEEFVKNYSSRNFKCTEKKYHDKTGQIKYMLFEEV